MILICSFSCNVIVWVWYPDISVLKGWVYSVLSSSIFWKSLLERLMLIFLKTFGVIHWWSHLVLGFCLWVVLMVRWHLLSIIRRSPVLLPVASCTGVAKKNTIQASTGLNNFFFKLYNIVLVLPYINMNLPHMARSASIVGISFPWPAAGPSWQSVEGSWPAHTHLCCSKNSSHSTSLPWSQKC